VFFFQAEDGIRDYKVTGVQTCALPISHLIQVGAGSGGMPVLDMVCRDPRVTGVTLIEPDIYKPHNVERHFFSPDGVGEPKAELRSEERRVGKEGRCLLRAGEQRTQNRK